MELRKDRVQTFIEKAFLCQVETLEIRPVVGFTDTFKIDGHADRKGKRLSIGGTVNPHNFSGLRVWTDVDDPFKGL